MGGVKSSSFFSGTSNKFILWSSIAETWENVLFAEFTAAASGFKQIDTTGVSEETDFSRFEVGL